MVQAVGLNGQTMSTTTVLVHIRNGVRHNGFLYKQGREYDIDKETAARWNQAGIAYVVPGQPGYETEAKPEPERARIDLRDPGPIHRDAFKRGPRRGNRTGSGRRRRRQPADAGDSGTV